MVLAVRPELWLRVKKIYLSDCWDGGDGWSVGWSPVAKDSHIPAPHLLYVHTMRFGNRLGLFLRASTCPGDYFTRSDFGSAGAIVNRLFRLFRLFITYPIARLFSSSKLAQGGTKRACSSFHTTAALPVQITWEQIQDKTETARPKTRNRTTHHA